MNLYSAAKASASPTQQYADFSSTDIEPAIHLFDLAQACYA